MISELMPVAGERDIEAPVFDVDCKEMIAFIGNDSKRKCLALRNVIRRYGGRWHGRHQRFELPLDEEALSKLARALYDKGLKTESSPEMRAWLRREDLAQLLHGEPPAEWLQDPTEYHVTPYKHQPIGTEWLMRSDRCVLGDDMGLGKTKEAIDAVWMLHKRKELRTNKVVVVCPNSLKLPWLEEGQDMQPGMAYLVPGGTTQHRKLILEECERQAKHLLKPYWIILNYEALRWFPNQFLSLAHDSVLICDEFHRLKNGRAKVSKIIAAARPARLWGLTGTLVSNHLEDAWHTVNLIRPGLLGWGWYEFELRHCVRNKFNAIYKYRDVDRITRAIALCSLGRKKSQCLDLPPLVWTKRVVDLSAEERKAYDTMKKEMVTWLEDAESGEGLSVIAQEYSTRFVRLRQLAHGLASDGEGGHRIWSTATKIKETIQTWKDAGRPRIVIWFQFRDVLAKALDLFVALPDSPVVNCIHGGIPVGARQELVKSWGLAPGAVLLCQMDTAGEGLNLQAASLEIFCDLPSTPKQKKQCADRLHRIGQADTVTVVDIIAKDTVDNGIRLRLRGKVKMADQAEAGAYGVANVQNWRVMLG